MCLKPYTILSSLRRSNQNVFYIKEYKHLKSMDPSDIIPPIKRTRSLVRIGRLNVRAYSLGIHRNILTYQNLVGYNSPVSMDFIFTAIVILSDTS